MQRGNILFLILLAVVLFAALSYAVTSSMRGGGKDASGESLKTQASAIVQHATAIASAVTRMRLVNGCSDTQISFAYDSNGDGVVNSSDRYHNAAAPSDQRCHVFSLTGGGAANALPDPKWLDTAHASSDLYGYWNYTGEEGIDHVGTSCLSAECKELMARVLFLKKDLCVAINDALGIPNTGGEPPSSTGGTRAHITGLFAGAYISNNSTMTIANNLRALAGKPAGCLRTNNLSGASFPNTYVFYSVLIER